MSDMQMPDLNSAAISDVAIALMGFQRTKQITPAARDARMSGDPTRLAAEARARRDAIFQGAVAEIYREYLPLRAFLRENGIAPGHVIDIGCGQAINDVFLAEDFGCRFTLVDIENTDAQYHGWSDTGAGYASLADAKALLVDAGTPDAQVDTFNPRRNPDAVAWLKGDLVTSLFSCAFHYPITEYLDLFCDTVAAGGAVVLDFRNHYLRRNPVEVQRLLAMGEAHLIEAHEKSKRLLIRR